MIKSDLREQGYSVSEIFPKQSKINTLWIVLTLVFIAGTFVSLFFFANPKSFGGGGHGPPPSDDDIFIYIIESLGVMGYFIFAVLTVLVYLLLKLFMTILFCRKSESIKMKLLKNKGMPVCYCREALRVWQTVLIYFVPFVLIYGLCFFLCVRYIANPEFMIVTFFMLFFLVFDFTLVVFVLAVKIKERPDYISIDHHIFGYTLYKKTYVKFNRKKQSRFIKKENEKSEKNIESGRFNWKN